MFKYYGQSPKDKLNSLCWDIESLGAKLAYYDIHNFLTDYKVICVQEICLQETCDTDNCSIRNNVRAIAFECVNLKRDTR